MGTTIVLLAVAAMLLAAVLAADWIAGTAAGKPQEISCVAVMPLTGNSDCLEASLRWTYICLRRGFDGYAALCLLDEGASEEELAIAEAFCRGHDGVLLTTRENLCAILTEPVYKSVRIVLY